MLALLTAAPPALQPVRSPRFAARAPQPRCQFKTGEGAPLPDKAAKREELAALFGEDAADRLAQLTPREKAEAEARAMKTRVEFALRAKAESFQENVSNFQKKISVLALFP